MKSRISCTRYPVIASIATDLLRLSCSQYAYMFPPFCSRSSCGSFFFFSSRRRHTRFDCDWSSDVCSSDLQSVSVNDLWERIQELAGVPVLPKYAEGRPGEVRNSLASIDKARELVGYEPEIGRAHV